MDYGIYMYECVHVYVRVRMCVYIFFKLKMTNCLLTVIPREELTCRKMN